MDPVGGLQRGLGAWLAEVGERAEGPVTPQASPRGLAPGSPALPGWLSKRSQPLPVAKLPVRWKLSGSHGGFWEQIRSRSESRRLHCMEMPVHHTGLEVTIHNSGSDHRLASRAIWKGGHRHLPDHGGRGYPPSGLLPSASPPPKPFHQGRAEQQPVSPAGLQGQVALSSR